MSGHRRKDGTHTAATRNTHRETNPTPNVLLIHCDQLRYDGLGCCGSSYAVTPNIDALAARGRIFSRHIVSNTICQPSRASLLTGLYPPAHGVWANGPTLLRLDHAPGPIDWLDRPTDAALTAQPPTMADVFAAAGYRTAAFGKMHLQPMLAAPEHRFEESLPYWRTGAMEDWTGPFYGFEHVELCLGHHENQLLAEGHYARWIRARDPELTDHVLANQPDERYQLWEGPVPADLHVTSWLAQRVRSYIVDAGSRRQGGEGPKQPFCAFVGFPTPHHPFAPSPEYLARFESAHVGVPRDPEGSFLRASTAHRLHTDWPPVADLREEPDFVRQARRYTAAMISQIDDAVGQILASLEESGQADNTIVVLTSDHGDFLGEHGLLFKHELASDSLLHVPFLIRGPGVPPGTTDDELMSNVDVLPTLSGLTGIDCGDSIDGIDRSAVGSGADHAAISCNYGPVIGHNSRLRMNHTIYRENYRYTVYPKLRLEELFDLEQDPGETTNLLDRPRQSASPGSDTGETPRATADRLRAELAERLMDISVPVGRRYALF